VADLFCCYKQGGNMENVFKTLSQINVNDHTEKKNNLTYLSWAWALTEAKKIYPKLKRKVYETESGRPYFEDGITAWVKTSVTIDEHEEIDYLPIMDFKNKSIPADKVTSFDVNKAIQRSLTKCLGYHGLGLYIYAGEDLPEQNTEEIKAKECIAKIMKGIAYLEKNGQDKVYINNSLKKHLGILKISDLKTYSDIDKMEEYIEHLRTKFEDIKKAKSEA